MGVTSTPHRTSKTIKASEAPSKTSITMGSSLPAPKPGRDRPKVEGSPGKARFALSKVDKDVTVAHIHPVFDSVFFLQQLVDRLGHARRERPVLSLLALQMHPVVDL